MERALNYLLLFSDVLIKNIYALMLLKLYSKNKKLFWATKKLLFIL